MGIMTTRHGAFLPMETAGTHHLINRTLPRKRSFPVGAETYINADEADATSVMFGIEWQAVSKRASTDG